MHIPEYYPADRATKGAEVSAVGVVVLNWNNTEDTLEFLASIYRATCPGLQVILVDNGSKENPEFVFLENYPNVHYVRTELNLGISGGNNLGIRAALALGCEYIVLMNNDTVVAPDFLSQLVTVCETDTAIGIVGSMIMYYSEPTRIQVAGFRFTDGSAFGLNMRGSEIVVRGLNEIDIGQFNGPEEVQAVSGCAMLIRRDVIEMIGLQHPAFYIYFQDFEFCLRASRAGFRCVLVPKSRVWHKGGRTLSAECGNNSPTLEYWYAHDRCLYMREMVGLARFLWQWSVITLREVLAWIVRRDKSERRWAFFRGSFAGLARSLVTQRGARLRMPGSKSPVSCGLTQT